MTKKITYLIGSYYTFLCRGSIDNQWYRECRLINKWSYLLFTELYRLWIFKDMNLNKPLIQYVQEVVTPFLYNKLLMDKMGLYLLDT